MAFLVFEGLDGAGKSTLIDQLKVELSSLGHRILVSREPGGTELGEEIRRSLLSKRDTQLSSRAELLLYQASRAQHVDEFILPARKRDYWVLCDRYTGSSLAFQSGGRGIEEPVVQWLNDFATDKCKPEMTILLDLPVETSQDRRQNREADRIEMEPQSFHAKVRDFYLYLAKKDPSWVVIDAQCRPDEILNQALLALKKAQLI